MDKHHTHPTADRSPAAHQDGGHPAQHAGRAEPMDHAQHPPVHEEGARTHSGNLADPRDVDLQALIADDHTAHGHDAHGGHDKHAGHSVAMFRDRFWISLLLSIPVVLYSEMVQEWLGFSMPSFPGSDLIPPVLGALVFAYGGRVFLQGGWAEVRARAPGMHASSEHASPQHPGHRWGITMADRRTSFQRPCGRWLHPARWSRRLQCR